MQLQMTRLCLFSLCDNFSVYGAGTSGEVATSMFVADVTTGTQGAGKGQKFGRATVTVVDNLGAPVVGANVSGTFSGTWNEAVSGITDTSGTVVFLTTTSTGGGVTVNFCVNTLTGNLNHDQGMSNGLCQ